MRCCVSGTAVNHKTNIGALHAGSLGQECRRVTGCNAFPTALFHILSERVRKLEINSI
jgi:hypothetical protein